MTRYYVQRVDRPYAHGPAESDWETVHTTDSARGAALRLRELRRWYTSDHGMSYSGHARIVGDDGFVYEPNQERHDQSGMPRQLRRPMTDLPWLEPEPYSQYDADARRSALGIT